MIIFYIIRGHYADLNNAGGKVGASCAAAFLENFVEKGVKWFKYNINCWNKYFTFLLGCIGISLV